MLRTAVFLYILTGFVNIHKSKKNISLSCKTQKKHKMISILKNEAIRYFVDSNKKLFDAIYVDEYNRIKCKIYKNNKNGATYLYLLNNFVRGARPYDGFIPAEYGFRHSYYLAHILDYEVNGQDSRSPFVYLIKENKINNIKIKIK